MWKESGLSIKAFTESNETVEIGGREVKSPHHSTVYGWAQKLGYSYEPGGSPNAPETPQDLEESDETNESGEPSERGETGGDTQTGENGASDEEEPSKEAGNQGEESDVLLKERVTGLETPQTPAPQETAAQENPKPRTNMNQSLLIIGGAAVVLIGGFMVLKMLRKPKTKTAPQTDHGAAQGGDVREVNPFDRGLRTLDNI